MVLEDHKQLGEKRALEQTAAILILVVVVVVEDRVDNLITVNDIVLAAIVCKRFVFLGMCTPCK